MKNPIRAIAEAFTSTSKTKGEAGFSMVEVCVVIGIAGIMMSSAIPNIKVLENPLADASFYTAHHLRLVRAKAISRTKSLRVGPINAVELGVEEADSCTSATSTVVSDLNHELPSGTSFNDLGWSICFTPRGFCDDYYTITINGSDGNTRTLAVALGGGVESI